MEPFFGNWRRRERERNWSAVQIGGTDYTDWNKSHAFVLQVFAHHGLYLDGNFLGM